MTNTPRQPNRPNRPNPPQNRAFTRPKPRTQNQAGGNNRSNNQNSNNNNRQPNPWLLEEKPPIDNSAGFTEYLRWMREADSQYKDGTKVEILQKIQDNSQHYNSRLAILNQRTSQMAETVFEAKSTWRIRVGGHRGVENILLPAFDALGMPYIPASSLRGVARNYAIREIIKNQGLEWKEAEEKIAPYFGSITTNNKANQMGKIVFFDAYPKEGCLEMDMVNNIWKWDGDNLNYSSNPNPFLSLKNATFVIGLRLASNCQDQAILEQVKSWLINGLSEGIGSQINSGYGQLKESKTKIEFPNKFLKMDFLIKGQLIHGSQQINNIKQPFKKYKNGDFKLAKNGKYQYDTYVDEEVRVTAFKSMLRYWFRAFALGVLPIKFVQEWEGKLFGLIQPKHTAWVKFNLINGKLIESEDKSDRQKGTLILSYSPFILEDKKTVVLDLFNNLIWLTFRLGGVGQGARRSYYERNNNPYYRGSKIYPKNPDDDKFWTLSKNGEQLCIKFQKKIKNFYKALEKLTNKTQLVDNISQFSRVTEDKWSEVVDLNCKIILVSGTNNGNKPFALNLLHQEFHKLENQWNDVKKEIKKLEKDKKLNHQLEEKQREADKLYAEMKSLCGGTQKEKNFYGKNQDRDVMPSPIWTSDLKLFEVVTVFGATENPRQNFLQILEDNATQYHQIFPFN